MPDIRFKKILGQMFISGVIKGTFFRKSKDLELLIFFTPIKGKIVEIIPIGFELDEKKINIDFKIGDDISLVRDWCQINGHQITFEKK